jgi:UDP-N-acetylmuramyl tripeptide synthase
MGTWMYRDAKVSFFTDYLDNRSIAVINRDNADGEELAGCVEECEKKNYRSRNHPACDVRAETFCLTSRGFRSHFLPSGCFDFHIPLVGRFNMENIVCGGYRLCAGSPPETINRPSGRFSTVPGRGLKKL